MITGPMEVRVLFIDDSQADVEVMLRVLRRGRIFGDWRRVKDPQSLSEALDHFNAAIVLARYPLPEFPAYGALSRVRGIRPDLPFVFVTDAMTEAQTIHALREGAADVIQREPAALAPAVRRALAQADERLAREHAQRRLGTQYEVARVLAEAVSLREAVTRIFKAICEREGFVFASMWKLAPGDGALQCVDIWSNGDPAIEVFADEVRGMTIAAGIGLTGQAWSNQRPVWISDLSSEPGAPQVESNAGLRSGVAFPVTFHGVFQGVMVFRGYGARDEEPELLEMFQAIGSQIGQFIDRELQRTHVTRLNRVYAVMSEINATIVRVEDRQTLFNEACRIAMEQGNFGIAWIGDYDSVSLVVTPVAWRGLNVVEHTATRSTVRADVPEGQGTMAQAIRTQKPAYCNDLSAQPGVGGIRRQEALRRGYRSQIALPFLLEGNVTGVLSLFAAEAGFFTDDEVRLLTELADNISFSLEHLAKKAQINYLANRDAVTGVANRNLLNEHLLQSMAQATRAGHMVAIAVLKVENFRLINESLGHNVGDSLLKMLASHLSACIRKTDTLARLGGGEFVLVLPLKSEAFAVTRVMHRVASTVFEDGAALETLRCALIGASQPLQVAGRDLQPKCSLGVALYPQDGVDAESLLKNAAAAATHAREHGGRNFQFYTADLNTRLSQQLTLQTALRHAVDNQEFSLYYQPKLNLLSGESSGAEGLLRWNHPERGLLLPSHFIANLEETGQIINVGRWVMAQALADYQRWRIIHPRPPRIAVNVSAVQLAQADFAASIENLLREINVSGPVGLDIEITESVIMEDLHANIAKLKVVRDMGINIIIDDFGTGYSSLSYLAKLPGNTLKIDRSFVQDMEASQDTLTIVTTIISLAHSLGLKVVAEGVETEPQKNTLLRLHCDEIQGYLVSHPLPCAQFEAWWGSRER